MTSLTLTDLRYEADRLSGEVGLQYYIGAGKDGTAYALDSGQVMKIWHEEFRARQQEVDLQRSAYEIARGAGFHVPQVVSADYDCGMAMERVPGNTVYNYLYRRGYHIGAGIAEVIADAVRELDAAGIIHNDPHIGNLALSSVEIVEEGGKEVIVDGCVWIIDFSRSREGPGESDLRPFWTDIRPKINHDW